MKIIYDFAHMYRNNIVKLKQFPDIDSFVKDVYNDIEESGNAGGENNFEYYASKQTLDYLENTQSLFQLIS